MSNTLPPPEKPMADITKQLASALRMYLSAYQAMDQAAAIRAADRAAHESLAALASQPAARVALTWDQFVAACEAEYGEDFAPEEFVDVPEDQKEELMRVVRMVERAHGISEYALAARQQAQVPAHGWTDADADAARLALELECLLTDRDVPMPVASRWWESAHDALALHRQRLESERAAMLAAAKGVME